MSRTVRNLALLICGAGLKRWGNLTVFHLLDEGYAPELYSKFDSEKNRIVVSPAVVKIQSEATQQHSEHIHQLVAKHVSSQLSQL
jgi:hypothetical protein